MDLYEKALQAVQDVFSDTSVSQTETLENLKAIQDQIALLIDTIETDLETE